MRRRAWLPPTVALLVLGLGAPASRAQVAGAGMSTYASGTASYGAPGLPLFRSGYVSGSSTQAGVTATAVDPYAAPGNFGMAYGTASYGVPRTYTAFSSPYGPGYGYGYAGAGYLPGRYGVGLWRPGFVAPGYVYGSGFYRTFPVPYRPVTGGPVPPPVGAYAPGFGPSNGVRVW
jgi:hypothetical protein